MAKAQERAPLHVLLAGGGTGGHVFPALSVAGELRSRGWQVSYVGAEGGLEARLARREGIPFHALPARPVVGQGVVGKALAVLTLCRSAWKARGLMRSQGVDAVLGTGGYLSAPGVLGARLAHRPVVLLEPNARAGVANRWLSRWAAEAAVAYPSTAQELRCPTRVTGAPVRREFFDSPPAAPPKGAPRVLVLGGSQGALQLNQLLPAALAQVRKAHPGLAVTHQCGERHLQVTRDAYAETWGDTVPSNLRVVPFLDDVAGAMAESHLIVSRAGALTLAEICASGRPSLLVPLAGALGHQKDNAAALEEAGAAEVVLGAEAERDAVARRLEALLGDADRLSAMASAARGLAREDAASLIADRLADLAQGQRRAA